MQSTFAGAWAFNQDLAFWDVAGVTTMVKMFFQARAFDSDLSRWRVSRVTAMTRCVVCQTFPFPPVQIMPGAPALLPSNRTPPPARRCPGAHRKLRLWRRQGRVDVYGLGRHHQSRVAHLVLPLVDRVLTIYT